MPKKNNRSGIENGKPSRDPHPAQEFVAGQDATIDSALRPKTWDEYVGQKKIKESLKIILGAAKKRKEVVDHLLLHGPAGVGKTTLAYLIASEFGANIRITSGTALKKAGDLAAVLSSLEENDILFVDECHRIGRAIEEMLYPAMESRKLHIVIGKGLGGREISLTLPAFSLIGATTRADLLSSPLRSRFGASFRFDYYEPEEIELIVRQSASVLKTDISDGAIRMVAGASRFTPRFANRLVKRSRDLAEMEGSQKIDEGIVEKTLELLELDELGLENFERELLKILIVKFDNRPVGIGTLAAAIGEERRVIEEMYEPFLVKAGFLLRTAKGRTASEYACRHLKINKDDPNSGNPS